MRTDVEVKVIEPDEGPRAGPDGAPDTPYDVLTMGRIGVDLYPLEAGVPLAEVSRFGRFLGGSATNVAVAAARLGRRSAVITRTGQDPFGDYAHQELRRLGVDDRWVTPVPGLPTPVTFCEIFPPDHFPLYFYRQPKAPDLVIHPDELALDAVAAARVFWMTGTGLSEEPSRTATLTALAHRARAGLTVFDLDWRPMFWPAAADRNGATAPGATPEAAASGTQALGRGQQASVSQAPGQQASVSQAPGPQAPVPQTPGSDPQPPGPDIQAARRHYTEALRHATVAVGNLDEVEVATGEREPRAAARALLAAGVALAVVKQGPKGVLAMSATGEQAEVPPLPVRVLNGLGAGDAFGGALCHGLLAGWDLERTMRYANAAGAIVAGRLECSSAMPAPAEIEAALAAGAVR